MEEPVHLGFFGYELSDWQATIVEIELMLVKRELEGLEDCFRLVTFSNSLPKRQAIISFSSCPGDGTHQGCH